MIHDVFNPRPDATDALEEGFYLLTMSRSQRVDVPIAIWFGPPPDMDDESSADLAPRFKPTLDRSPRWMVEVNGVLFGDPDNPACIAGRPIDHIDEVWPRCQRAPLHEDGPRSAAAEAEYRYRTDRATHAERYDGADPFGGTGRKIDPLTAPLPEYVE